jgi:hypothetical protein
VRQAEDGLVVLILRYLAGVVVTAVAGHTEAGAVCVLRIGSVR